MLALIPARAGSKGIPGKNIKLLMGKPLIAYSILAALAAKEITEVIVSTDSEEIARIAMEYGAETPFLRPKELAQDDSLAIDTYLYVLDNLGKEGKKINDFVVLLPTAPLRFSQDIDAAIQIFKDKKADSVISVCEAPVPIDWHLDVREDKRLVPIFYGNKILANRQASEKTYIPNGSIYVFNYEFLRKNRNYYGENTFPYIMPKERSVDIDEFEDFQYAEFLLRRRYFKERIR